MKLFSISLTTAALFALAPLASQAQHSHAGGKPDAHTAPGETHAHVAPHGGVVRSANPYHMELVQHTGELHIYLLADKNASVPSKSLSGTVMVQTTDNKTMTVTLVAGGTDHLVAKLPARTKVRTAIVSLKADGKAINTRFDKLDAGAQGSKAVGAAYECPMKCEGSASSKPGTCPKCGMALVKKA
ncbi:heavy metal-binding domain-containing protein [Hymenobacter wooponensis]|jgi:hypothetical protein|uniref:Heavy metal binding domain-containing protein n=1 Tax=Hymenobacter wooponensis TaxID=1525360 RepID=A0A4Z0MDJ7_9BACT|nr:heavy metal-binding domain-containing protein [Hymenobacter wooponensis]TGD77398.1 hypothetical protein EU557_23850 [Hymenobacter wooponensis]